MKTKDNLVLPEFDLTFMKVIHVALQKIITVFAFRGLENDLATMMNKLYHDKDNMAEIEKYLFSSKEHRRIKDADDLMTELIQSFYKLRLSITLAYEIDEQGRMARLERISYFKENFYNEYSIFIGRVIRYFNTLKNDVSEYKEVLIGYSAGYKQVFKEHSDKRNEHIHFKRINDSIYQQTAIIEMADQYGVNSNLPDFDEKFVELQKQYVNEMTGDLKFLYDNTEKVLNEFGENVFGYLIQVN